MESTGAGTDGSEPTASGLRSRLGLVRNQAIAPIMARLDAIDARLDRLTGRIDEQSRRIDGVDAFMQMMEARVSTASERVAMHVESETRIRRRLDAIAESLGSEGGRFTEAGFTEAGFTDPGGS